MNAPWPPATSEDEDKQWGLTLDAVMPDEPVLPLSVEGYHALLKAGVLVEGAPVELLEGFMVVKMPKGPRHEGTRRRVRRLLEQFVPANHFVDEQGPLTTDDSEPEPDVFVVRGTLEDFETRHPTPEEAVLIVEVADSSLRRDLGKKRRIYARAGVACYWLVNLVEETIEVFRQPSGPAERPAYAERTVFVGDEEVPVIFDGREVGRISAATILGKNP